jgi:hypothetical protein
LKNVAEEDDAERKNGTKVWSMDAFAEDWGESQFWVRFSFPLLNFFSFGLGLVILGAVLRRNDSIQMKRLPF